MKILGIFFHHRILFRLGMNSIKCQESTPVELISLCRIRENDCSILCCKFITPDDLNVREK